MLASEPLLVKWKEPVFLRGSGGLKKKGLKKKVEK